MKTPILHQSRKLVENRANSPKKQNGGRIFWMIVHLPVVLANLCFSLAAAAATMIKTKTAKLKVLFAMPVGKVFFLLPA